MPQSDAVPGGIYLVEVDGKLVPMTGQAWRGRQDEEDRKLAAEAEAIAEWAAQPTEVENTVEAADREVPDHPALDEPMTEQTLPTLRRATVHARIGRRRPDVSPSRRPRCARPRQRRRRERSTTRASRAGPSEPDEPEPGDQAGLRKAAA